MRCFKHQDREAIGSCKACYKGLCVECAADLDHGLACKGHHESAVEIQNAIISKVIQTQQVAPKTKSVALVFYAFMGVVFMVYGFITEGIGSFLFIMGVGFLVFTVIVMVLNRHTLTSRKTLK